MNSDENKKTVFIVGAGASVPYGYPTATELRNDILKLKDGIRRDYIEALYSLYAHEYRIMSQQHFERDFATFVTDFAEAGSSTIDKFLIEQTKYYQTLGKYVIAHAILSRENHSSLFSNAQNWCHYIWNYITNQNGNDPCALNPKFGFITFNYDMSLEILFQKFYRKLYASKIKTNDVKEFLDKLPIVHVHGCLMRKSYDLPVGKYCEMIGLNETTRAFDISDASCGIRLIDNRMSEDVAEKAYQMIDGAENVVFLGFGFDLTNVEKINFTKRYSGAGAMADVLTGKTPQKLFLSKNLYATCKGLDELKKTEIKEVPGLERLEFLSEDIVTLLAGKRKELF